MKFASNFAYAKEIGFSDVEFKVQTNKKLKIETFHRKVEKYVISENSAIYVRGIINGNLVSGYTEDKKNINDILDTMKKHSTLIECKKAQKIFEGSAKYHRLKKQHSNLAEVPVNKKIDFCFELEDEVRKASNLVVEVETSYNENLESLEIYNSHGLNLSYKNTYAYVFAEVVASKDKDTRTGFEVKITDDFNAFDAKALAAKAVDKAVKSLGGIQCASKKYKILLTQDVFASFVNAFVRQASGDAVNKQKTLLASKLHQKVGSSKLTISEDPFVNEYPFMARNFDDEGVATYKKDIVKNGVLETFLYNIEAAMEAKRESTGNGYGGSNIGISTAFLRVKPGKRNEDELLKFINNGVKITSLQGMHSGFNPISGDFSLQAAGFLIENGKITTPLNLITVAGNMYKMFEDIQALGNDVELSLGGVLTPSVVVKNLAISGK